MKFKSTKLTSVPESVLTEIDKRIDAVCSAVRAEKEELENKRSEIRSELERLSEVQAVCMEQGEYERYREVRRRAEELSEEYSEYTERITALEKRCTIPPEECKQMGRQINREVIGQFADFAEEYIRLRQEMASLANRYGYVFRYSNDLLSRILYTVHYQSKLDAGGAIRFLHYGEPQQLPDLMLANIARFLRDPVYQNINLQELRRHTADIKGGE